MQYTITETGIQYMIEDNEADAQEAEAEAEQPPEMTLQEALIAIAAVARQVEAIE